MEHNHVRRRYSFCQFLVFQQTEVHLFMLLALTFPWPPHGLLLSFGLTAYETSSQSQEWEVNVGSRSQEHTKLCQAKVDSSGYTLRMALLWLVNCMGQKAQQNPRCFAPVIVKH